MNGVVGYVSEIARYCLGETRYNKIVALFSREVMVERSVSKRNNSDINHSASNPPFLVIGRMEPHIYHSDYWVLPAGFYRLLELFGVKSQTDLLSAHAKQHCSWLEEVNNKCKEYAARYPEASPDTIERSILIMTANGLNNLHNLLKGELKEFKPSNEKDYIDTVSEEEYSTRALGIEIDNIKLGLFKETFKSVLVGFLYTYAAYSKDTATAEGAPYAEYEKNAFDAFQIGVLVAACKVLGSFTAKHIYQHGLSFPKLNAAKSLDQVFKFIDNALAEILTAWMIEPFLKHSGYPLFRPDILFHFSADFTKAFFNSFKTGLKAYLKYLITIMRSIFSGQGYDNPRAFVPHLAYAFFPEVILNGFVKGGGRELFKRLGIPVVVAYVFSYMAWNTDYAKYCTDFLGSGIGSVAAQFIISYIFVHAAHPTFKTKAA